MVTDINRHKRLNGQVVWKKHMVFDRYTLKYMWMYSEIVPNNLTLSEFNLTKKDFRHKKR